MPSSVARNNRSTTLPTSSPTTSSTPRCRIRTTPSQCTSSTPSQTLPRRKRTERPTLWTQDGVSGSSTPIQASSDIRSAQGFDVTLSGLILFEHSNYKGYGQKFVISDNDINNSFPAGTRGGVSSAVVTGGKWRLWTKRDMQGAYIDLTMANPLNPSFVPLGMNDRVQSVQRIG